MVQAGSAAVGVPKRQRLVWAEVIRTGFTKNGRGPRARRLGSVVKREGGGKELW